MNQHSCSQDQPSVRQFRDRLAADMFNVDGLYFTSVIERGDTRLHSYIHVPCGYPRAVPVFICLLRDTTKMVQSLTAANSTTIRVGA